MLKMNLAEDGNYFLPVEVKLENIETLAPAANKMQLLSLGTKAEFLIFTKFYNIYYLINLGSHAYCRHPYSISQEIPVFYLKICEWWNKV